MEIRVSGVQKGDYLIHVKNGVVVKMTSDGVEAPKHVWDFWTVEGMFRFLEDELDQSIRKQNAFGESDLNHIHLSATFDSKLGYPKHFMRQIFGRPLTVEWKVVRFEPNG